MSTGLPERKRVLVVGCGSIGRRHLRLLHERPDVAAAACDPDTAAAEGVTAIGAAIPFFTDLPAALREHRPDFAVVANPNRFHADAALAAMKAGAHVLCEKPIADTLANGRRIVAAATDGRNGRVSGAAAGGSPGSRGQGIA